MGEINDDGPPLVTKHVEAPRILFRGRPEGTQSVPDGVKGHAQRERRGGGRERVLDVVPRGAAECNRYLSHGEDGFLMGATRIDHQPIAKEQGFVTPREVLLDGDEIRLAAEEHDAAGSLATETRGGGIRRIEDAGATGANRPNDNAFDVDQFLERLHTIQPEMIRGHVGHNADIRLGHAEALQQDAAAGNLEHPNVDSLLRQRSLGSLRTCVVTFQHLALPNPDAIRCCDPRRGSSLPKDAGKEAGRGALAVGAGNRHHGHPCRTGGLAPVR